MKDTDLVKYDTNSGNKYFEFNIYIYICAYIFYNWLILMVKTQKENCDVYEASYWFGLG